MNSVDAQPRSSLAQLSLLGRWKLYAEVQDTRGTRICFWFPLVGVVIAAAVAGFFGPQINPGDDHQRYSDLFSTTAQVIATLLVALALESGIAATHDIYLRRLVSRFTVSYVALGVGAAIIALNPSLSSCAYRILFTVAMAAGAGALLSVVAVGYYAVESEIKKTVDDVVERSRKPGVSPADPPAAQRATPKPASKRPSQTGSSSAPKPAAKKRTATSSARRTGGRGSGKSGKGRAQ